MPDNVSILKGGGSVPCGTYTVKTGDTINNGDFVILNNDDTVSPATATSAALLGRARPDFFTGKVIVELALPTVWFKVRLDNAAVVPKLGTEGDLIVAASGEHQYDSDATAVGVLKVQGFPEDVVTVSGVAYVYVAVPADKSQAVQA